MAQILPLLGVVSCMELYSMTTDLIGQEGRRGALMLTLADSHPDMPSFLSPPVPRPSPPGNP